MATCPKCSGKVPYLKLMRHTRRTPVICPHCNSRLQFDKQDWTKKAWTFTLLLLLLNIICLIGACAWPSYAFLVVLALLGPTLLVKFLFDVRNIKLQEKEVGELSNKPTGGNSY
jgi:CXXC-20-CXXC protein